MKSKIFIGSSSESIEIAKEIEHFFSTEYDCVIWQDRFFQLNQSVYDTLLKKSAYFDYAIFVGGKDDIVKRSGTSDTKNAVRDNVYFELGLYTGTLSKARTYFFVHRDIKIASDLFGVTVVQYEKTADVLNGCQCVRERMKEEARLNRITLLPSTSLAMNYYKNFLEPLGNVLSDYEVIFYEGNEHNIQSWVLQIVIPINCNENWRMWANQFYKYHSNGNLEISGKPRNFAIKFDVDRLLEEKKLIVLDIPQVLCASFEAVEMVAEKNYIGYTDDITYMKKKEVKNFIKTLNNLIEGNPILRNRVQIIRMNDCNPHESETYKVNYKISKGNINYIDV